MKYKPNFSKSYVIWDRLKQMKFPVSLIYGENDKTVIGYDSKILEQLSNSKYTDVNIIGLSCGHSSRNPKIIRS